MDANTSKVKGKFFTVVRDGAAVIHITRKYLTRRMAEAAAKCWQAFHGEAKPMDRTCEIGCVDCAEHCAHCTGTNSRPCPKHDPTDHVEVSFVYFTPVTDGSTEQRRTATLDCTVPKGLANHDIATRAWRLLTRNWDKPGAFVTAQVTR